MGRYALFITGKSPASPATLRPPPSGHPPSGHPLQAQWNNAEIESPAYKLINEESCEFAGPRKDGGRGWEMEEGGGRGGGGAWSAEMISFPFPPSIHPLKPLKRP